MNYWIVGGTFDPSGGKPSFIVQCLHEALGPSWQIVNGGTVEKLREVAKQVTLDTANPAEVLIWMPNISNDEEKILPLFQRDNPSLKVIQSKRVVEKSYTLLDIQGRLQASQALLCIMITKPDIDYVFSLVTPEKDVIIQTTSIPALASTLNAHLHSLKSS